MADAIPVRDVGTEFALELNDHPKLWCARSFKRYLIERRPGERRAVLGSPQVKLLYSTVSLVTLQQGSVNFGEYITYFKTHERIRRD